MSKPQSIDETKKVSASQETPTVDLRDKNELTDAQLEKVAGGTGGLWGNPDRNPGG